MRRRREAALVVQEQNRPWRYRERRAAPPEQPVGGGGGGSTFPPFLFSAHTGAVFSVPRRFWLRRGPFSVSIPFWRCMQPETPPFLDSFYHSCVPCPVLHLIYFSSRRWLWRSKSNVRSPRVSLSRPPVFRLPPNEEEFPFQNLYTLSHEERSLLLPACLPAIMADIETCSRAMQGVSLDQSGESRPSPTPQGNKTPTLPSNLPTGALLRFFWVKNLCVCVCIGSEKMLADERSPVVKTASRQDSIASGPFLPKFPRGQCILTHAGATPFTFDYAMCVKNLRQQSCTLAREKVDDYACDEFPPLFVQAKHCVSSTCNAGSMATVFFDFRYKCFPCHRLPDRFILSWDAWELEISKIL